MGWPKPLGRKGMTYIAAYGTLRKYDNEKGRVKGYRLVVPGNFHFPAAIPYKDEEITVELNPIEEWELKGFDRYENVGGGLYKRKLVNVKTEDGEHEAWMYVAGDAMVQYSNTFKKVPNNDWECQM